VSSQVALSFIELVSLVSCHLRTGLKLSLSFRCSVQIFVRNSHSPMYCVTYTYYSTWIDHSPTTIYQTVTMCTNMLKVIRQIMKTNTSLSVSVWQMRTTQFFSVHTNISSALRSIILGTLVARNRRMLCKPTTRFSHVMFRALQSNSLCNNPTDTASCF
jgi:hypothetical protein